MTEVATLKCRRVSDLISYFVSGERAHAQARAVESHLADCAQCRLELESARRALRALQCPVTQLDPPEVAAAIRSKAAQRTPRLRSAYLRWLPVAAAVLVIALVVSLCRLSPTTNRPGRSATVKPAAPIVSPRDEKSTSPSPLPAPTAVDRNTQNAPIVVETPEKPRHSPKRRRRYVPAPPKAESEDVVVRPTDTGSSEDLDGPAAGDPEPEVVASVSCPPYPDDMEPYPLRDRCLREQIDPRPEPYVAVVHTATRPASPDRPEPAYYLQEEVTLTDANSQTYRVALMVLPYSRP